MVQPNTKFADLERGRFHVKAYSSLRHEALSLGELEQMRLLLRGGSVVDWYRLNFERRDEVEAFARLHGFDPSSEQDLKYLEDVRQAALTYLRTAHGYKIPAELSHCDLLDVPLYASEVMGSRRHRMFACILLKTIHVMHHINARELRARLAIADASLSDIVVQRITDCADRMRDKGFPILDFSGGQKQRDSLVAKLLVKRDNLAAEVYDRIRFRFVVERHEDLVPSIRYLLQHLLPFNYVVPNQTQNDLIDFTQLIRSHSLYRTYESRLQIEMGFEDRRRAEGPRNEFSGSRYRVINFVADLPQRVPDGVSVPQEIREKFGNILFLLTEFQFIDVATARTNDRGDAAHHRYKSRQRARERERLERGMRRRITLPF